MYLICLNSQQAKPIHNNKDMEVHNWRVFTVSQPIQKWTPTFRPEEETPIVPIWISLPELPWHCYHKDILSALLSSYWQSFVLGHCFYPKN